MNESLKLLKLTLSNELYTKYKDILLDTMFPSPVDTLWKVIKDAHKRYNRDITCPELLALYNANDGVVTEARRGSMESLLQDLEQVPAIGIDIAGEVIRVAYKRELGRFLIEKSYGLIDDRSEFDIQEVRKAIDQIENNYLPETKVDHIPTDVGELLNLFDQVTRWEFNIPGLKQHIGGLAPGEFAVFFARPELGKTAFWISLSCAPGGWCWQGANVHALCNEEFAKRNMIRVISSATGLVLDQIKEDIPRANAEFAGIKDRIKLSDCSDWGLDDIDSYCKLYKPDLLIIDQLDKVKTYDYKDTPSHEKLSHLYTGAREIGKRHSCVIIGISQASIDAEGKDTIDYSMLAGSKTGKAAEADLILGIGSNSIIEMNGNTPNMRCITASKNKLTGFHGQVQVKINSQLSRYEQ